MCLQQFYKFHLKTYKTLFNFIDAVLHENEERTHQGKKVREHVDKLVANSTLHGLHYCFDRQFWIRRIFWSVLILIALALVIQQLFEGANHFFKYPFFTVITTKHVSKLVFPAVSICNLNDFRFSVINGTWLNTLLVEGQAFNASKFDEHDFQNTIKKANHQMKNMLKKCAIQDLPCSFKNFTQYYPNDGNRCFTFNSGSPEHHLITVMGTQKRDSLNLVIDVEHDDYYHFTGDFGIRLTIHGQEETPVNKKGILLSPGFSTKISLKKRKVDDKFC